jgi:glutamate-ammonia-ligase adenylyltransferase
MGCADAAALASLLDAHRARVAAVFDGIFASAAGGEHPLAHVWQDSTDVEACSQALAQLGYRHPEDIGKRLKAMRAGSRYREMPAASQAQLDRLIPLTVESAAAEPEPDATLERMLDLLESVSRRSAYLALLEEYPQALTRLATMMSASPWVAQYLTQHPILLDELLDARALYTAPDWPAALEHLRAQLTDAGSDTEKQMDLLRHFKHAHTMRLIAQDLAGLLPIETLSDHLSDLACVQLDEVLRITWPTIRHAHRPDPRFAIIGYGKLGGKELGYAGDLDIVFLYDDDAPEAPEIYARYAQRVNAWLTTVTAAGVLYETDLRLRPDGAGGLLVSPLESFREYQAKHAWVWEHQALTRARFVAGDRKIGAAFEALRVDILKQPRDLDTLRREVLAMRQKLLDGHPNRSSLFDLKHDRGGLIDVEFAVQFLVLGYAHRCAELTGNIGNLALLKLAARLGLLTAERAQAAHDAYRRFRQLQHAVRLQGERYARVAPESVAAERRAVEALWADVLGEPK